MKKISLIPTMSVVASAALLLSLSLFSTSAEAKLNIYSCQTKVSCSGTTPIWSGDMDGMNQCKGCTGYTGVAPVQGDCPSGKVCMGNGACVTLTECTVSAPIYVATNNTCRAVQNSSECTSVCSGCVWVN